MAAGRVFVNNVDKYTGKEIGKILNGTAIGLTKGEDEEGDDEVLEGIGGGEGDGGTYEVIGTVMDQEAQVNWVKEVIKPTGRDDLLSHMLSCDAIIYSTVNSNELEEVMWAVQSLHDEMSSFASQKVFVFISTVLTWAKTKPLNPDEPDVPFTEEDYRRRHAHPNFKEQITVEKEVIKLGKTDKSKFVTYVIASGLQYGGEEDIFHYFFKTAWLGKEKELPVFGEGQNVVPTIHVQDLVSVIINVLDNKPKTKYILAVDESNNTLEDIVKAISKGLGTGKIKHLSREEALLIEDLAQNEYDQLMVNLLMEGMCIKERMKIEWKAESGLIDNLASVIGEYKNARGLLPIKICILGPPASGKTTIATQLCHHYKLHHIKMADVIKESLEGYQRRAARADTMDDNEEEDDSAQEAKDYLDVLKDDAEENKGRYSSQHILRFYKETLKSMPCQNQGFVLDGFPKKEEEAKELFAAEEQDEDDATQESYNKLLMPELVVSLEASNEFLKERVINLPHSEVVNTHNTEEGLVRRLKVFREDNEDDVTVLNYFDELEIHPFVIKVAEDTSENMIKTVEDIKKKIKEPRNYGLTPEEKEILEKQQEEERLARETREKEEKERQEALERELRNKREAEWSERLAQVQKEEQEMLETHSIPLRNYLMRHVMPTLTEGLIEVCKVRPDDPVDYLSEYLFKSNPQID